MQLKSHRYFMLVICGFLFLADRYLKWQALYEWGNDYLLNRFFGWHPFLNPGVAFSIPVPSWLIIALTLPILCLLGYLLLNEFFHVARSTQHVAGELDYKILSAQNGYVLRVMCYGLIFFGALSNLIDRVLYGYTIDYFLILTGVINLADVMIALGFVIYFVYSKNFVKPACADRI